MRFCCGTMKNNDEYGLERQQSLFGSFEEPGTIFMNIEIKEWTIMKKNGLKLTALLLAAGIISMGTYLAVSANSVDQAIFGGVYLDGVYVGGLTMEEAMEEYEH